MENPVAKIQENLRLGVKAARTGRNEEARNHLKAVLEQDEKNIIAMFWLAFVAPEPAESLHLLQRVLELEPDNERAKAGLLWVQQQIDSKASLGEPELTQSQALELSESLREQFLSKTEAQQRAKKGALAHRARRTIDPLLALTVILGAAIILTLGAWLIISGVSEDRIGWFLTFTKGAQTHKPAGESQVVESQPLSPSATTALKKSFTSQSDTIVMSQLQNPTGAEPAAHAYVMASSEVSSQEALSAKDILVSNEPVEFIGPGQLLPDGSRLFQPVDETLLVHQPASPDEKWIEVNVTEQRVTAWEGVVPVMSFLSSTGLPGTPTVLGEFNIYWKLESTLMSGPDYYLPGVPYTMYFYRGYGLHGAYWHNNFGQPMSHGCVNLSIEEAKQLFQWAEPVIPAGETQVVATVDNPGTLVVVHE
jgi:hypothetical protein